MTFFTKLEQKKQSQKNPQVAKAILRKKNGDGGINILTSGYTTEL